MKATPLPLKTMVILCTVIVSEPIALTILFPFVYFMIQDFGYPDKEIGYHIGLLASSFSFAQLLTSFAWGWLSDKIGRRPVLLIGLLGNAISLTLFGLSHSLQWAIMTRTISGLLNGNIGVAKSVLGEITDSSPAFSIIAMNFGLGLIIGPAIGGLLANPTKTFLFLSGCDFLRVYPYFLPCFISSLISLFGFVMGYLFLPETCKTLGYRKLSHSDHSRHLNNLDNSITGSYSELPQSPITATRSYSNSDHSPHSQSLIEGNDVTLIEVNDTTEHIYFEDLITPEIPAQSKSGIGMHAISSAVAYCILAFQNIIFSEIFTLWAVASPSIGLGFTSPQIGIVLSLLGVITLSIQIFIYNPISRIIPPLTLYRLPLFGYLIFYLLFPTIPTIISSYPGLKYLLWPTLLTLLGLKALCDNFTFTSIMILVFYTNQVSNSAKAGQLGYVNGIAQGAASLARAVGPALGGAMWAWSCSNNLPLPFNHYFVFIFLGLVTGCCILHSWGMMDESMNLDQE